MIVIHKPDCVRSCNSCSGREEVEEIECKNEGGCSVVVALCKKCRKELVFKLTHAPIGRTGDIGVFYREIRGMK